MRNSSPISPLLIIGLIWIVASILITNIRKASGRQNQSRQPSAAPKQAPAAEKKPQPPASSPVPPVPPVPPAPSVRKPYLGSLNVDSMEGIDPCHQEQMMEMDAPEAEETASAPARPGLTLSWSADDVVRGFVYSEVLNRKRKT